MASVCLFVLCMFRFNAAAQFLQPSVLEFCSKARQVLNVFVSASVCLFLQLCVCFVCLQMFLFV